MASSAAKTVDAYLKELPAEKRAVISGVRDVIRKSSPTGYEEVMQYGMIGYIVPLKVTGPTYNGQPLAVVCLAAQKNYFSLYMMAVYADGGERKRFEEAYAASGKKLNMGKSCVRFKALDDLPLPLIGETLARVPVETY